MRCSGARRDGVSHGRSGLMAAGALLGALVTVRAQAAVIVVDNLDLPGEGFNDLTLAVPIGGNAGTTLGQQRLNAVQYGADLWGSILASDVTIRVAARFDPLSCSSSGATLALAGANAIYRDFAGAPVPGTYYAAALADSSPGWISTRGSPTCARHSTAPSTTAAAASGASGTMASTQSATAGLQVRSRHRRPSRAGPRARVLLDGRQGDRCEAQRLRRRLHAVPGGSHHRQALPGHDQRRARGGRQERANLHWVGPSVVGATGSKTGGTGPLGHAHMYAPATSSGSSVSHWNTTMTPQEILEPFFTTPGHDPGLAVEALVDQGWTLLACGDGLVDPNEQCDDGNRASGDGCSAACTTEPCRTCSGEPSVCTPRADGASCSDGVFCNGADQCRAGSCTVHAGSPCPGPDGDGDCAESCDEAADGCTAADPDGSACSDGDACTPTDACDAGVCAGGTVTCMNHFLCYKAKTTRTFTFTPVIGASLSDQFDVASVFDVTKPKRLCTPADQDGGEVPTPRPTRTGTSWSLRRPRRSTCRGRASRCATGSGTSLWTR